MDQKPPRKDWKAAAQAAAQWMKRPSSKWIVAGIVLVCLLVGALAATHGGNGLPRVEDAEDAIRLLADRAQVLGYENALSELTEAVTQTVGGHSYYRLQQNYQGLPVYGRTVVYAADESGECLSVTQNIQDVPRDLDLTPTVTAEQATASVLAYLQQEYPEQSWDTGETVLLKENNLCIYNLEDTAHLAYETYMGFFELVVDAHDGTVLNCLQTINTANATFASSGESVDVIQLQSGEYFLKDVNSGTYVYSANGAEYLNLSAGTVFPANLVAVTSSDRVFGDSNDSVGVGSMVRAESALNCIREIREYYTDIIGKAPIENLILVYDDAMRSNQGRNAAHCRSSAGVFLNSALPDQDPQNTAVDVHLITLGTFYSTDPHAYMDIIAHEYTHGVTDIVVDWVSYKGENGAINEAFSDIFGELIQAAADGIDPDWNCASRPITDPSRQDYPEKLGEKIIFPTDGAWIFVKNESGELCTSDIPHGYSTIISHAAYKMWRGSDQIQNSAVPTRELAELWYRAMLLMPSDADFVDCRASVSLAAETMGLSEAQKDTIANAFDDAGIPDQYEEDGYYFEVAENLRLEVYGDDGELFPNFTVMVEEQPQNLLAVLRDDLLNFTSVMEEGETCVLLLEKGVYKITVYDTADVTQRVEFYVRSKKDGMPCLQLKTNFGNAEGEAPQLLPDLPENGESADTLPQAGEAAYELVKWDRSYTDQAQGWSNIYYYEHVVLMEDKPVNRHINDYIRSHGYSFMNRYFDEELQAQPITQEGSPEGLRKILESRVTHNDDGILSILLTDNNGMHSAMTLSLEVAAPLGLRMLSGKDSGEFREELKAAALSAYAGAGLTLSYDLASYLNGLALEDYLFFVEEGQIVLILPDAPDREEGSQLLPTGISISTAYTDHLRGAFQKPGTEAVTGYEGITWDRSVKQMFGAKYEALYHVLQEDSPAYAQINRDVYGIVEEFMTYRTEGELSRKYYDPDFQTSLGFSMFLNALVEYDEDGLVCYQFDYYNYMPGQGITEGRYNLVYSLSTGERISLAQLSGMNEEILLKLIKERILMEVSRNRVRADYREQLEALTLEDLNYGVWSRGEIVIVLPSGRIMEDTSGDWYISTGIHIH